MQVKVSGQPNSTVPCGEKREETYKRNGFCICMLGTGEGEVFYSINMTHQQAFFSVSDTRIVILHLGCTLGSLKGLNNSSDRCPATNNYMSTVQQS